MCLDVRELGVVLPLKHAEYGAVNARHQRPQLLTLGSQVAKLAMLAKVQSPRTVSQAPVKS